VGIVDPIAFKLQVAAQPRRELRRERRLERAAIRLDVVECGGDTLPRLHEEASALESVNKCAACAPLSVSGVVRAARPRRSSAVDRDECPAKTPATPETTAPSAGAGLVTTPIF
jgi:hypothetical protein